MKIKICGLKYKNNIEQVAYLRPDYMGFIFYDKSKRFVGEDFIMPVISSKIKKVGVFVNAKADYIIDKINKHKLDVIQLHGDEKPGFCKVMSHLITVIKSFGIDDSFDFKSIEPYKNCCDYFLFDTKTNEYGGSGKQFDWNIFKGYDNKIPFFLSGGIGLKELKSVSSFKLKVHAVDVNSRFEIEPGLKDIGKLEKIFKNENQII
jgi:phosphoribosylanthranilate isomerase